MIGCNAFTKATVKAPQQQRLQLCIHSSCSALCWRVMSDCKRPRTWHMAVLSNEEKREGGGKQGHSYPTTRPWHTEEQQHNAEQTTKLRKKHTAELGWGRWVGHIFEAGIIFRFVTTVYTRETHTHKHISTLAHIHTINFNTKENKVVGPVCRTSSRDSAESLLVKVRQAFSLKLFVAAFWDVGHMMSHVTSHEIT